MNNQYLYCDLLILTPLTLTMGITGPYKRLTKDLPTGSLMSMTVLVSVVGMVIIQFAFLGGMVYWIF